MSPFKSSTMTDKKIFTELTFVTVAVYLQCRGIPLGKALVAKRVDLLYSILVGTMNISIAVMG